MPMTRRVVFALSLLAAGATPAVAQDGPRVGIAMGYPAAVGVVWHITDAFALRPDVSVTRTSTETVTSIGPLFPGGAPVTSRNTSRSWSTSAGVSALFYVRTIDRLRFYVVPRAAYLRSTVDLEDDSGFASAFDTDTTGYLASGAFGAQYAVHDRFVVFGEIGAQYSSQKSKTSFSTTRNETESRAAGLRSAIGATLYF
jgi:hypothetical protein